MSKVFDDKKRRLWCHGPKPEFATDTDWADQWYIGARTIALIRPQVDSIILPGGNEETVEFWKFCRKVLGFEEGQVIWTSGTNYLLDDDIRIELLDYLRNKLRRKADWELVPYSVTQPFTAWASQLNISICGDEMAWVERWSNKGILHPHPLFNERPGDPPLLDKLVPYISVPRGYFCTSPQELEMAYGLLGKKVILKPVSGATGEGIEIITDGTILSSYAFPMGPVILEELLEIDRDPNGQLIAPSVQYFGDQLCGNVTDQIINGGVAHEGNVTPSITTPQFQETLVRAVKSILQAIQPRGPGGFDFLSVKGEPVLIDPNCGRFTGAHPAWIFRNHHAPQAFFQSWKIKPKNSVWEFWDFLGYKGLSLNRMDEYPKGIFPLCYLPGMWGMLIAIGETREETDRFREQADSYFL